MRLIDADAYAAEMKKRQDACMEDMETASYEGEQFSPKEHWEGVFAAFVEAKLTLDGMPTIRGWISVKEMMPEPNTNDEVLTTYVYDDKPGKYYVETATYWDDGEGTVQWDSVWDEYCVGNARKTVIAWMPMPKPYKPPKEEDNAGS